MTLADLTADVRCCACGCVDDACEGGPECVDPDEGFPLCSRW